MLTAAERNGALLVSLENLYGYGPTHGKPMTEDLPLAATTVKGRTRAAMTEELLAARDAGRIHIAIGRASDFFGAGVTEIDAGRSASSRNALAGRRADFIGNPDLAHTYSYVPDIAGRSGHPGHRRACRRRRCGTSQGPRPSRPGRSSISWPPRSDIQSASARCPSWPCGPSGLFNPMMRALVEMAYEFDEPFVLDTTKYETTFGAGGTALPIAIAATVAWYQGNATAPALAVKSTNHSITEREV